MYGVRPCPGRAFAGSSSAQGTGWWYGTAAQPGTGVPTGNEADGTDEVTDLFRALGRQIKVARERAGLSQRELGDRIGYGEETISSVERARRTPQPELLVVVDQLLDCGGLLASAAEDVERAKTRRRVRHPEWFRNYARLEAEAVGLHDYSSLAIPGLLQTEAHAHVVFGTRQPLLDEATVEQRVAARLDRQQIFDRWPPPFTTFTIEESVGRSHPRSSRSRSNAASSCREIPTAVIVGVSSGSQMASVGGPVRGICGVPCSWVRVTRYS